ncbi:hypothetical protein LTR85_000701 [Meristemomyces frigidus]|nr:hypothetical protein LTR85_000701 [Meristemomyces frigidus]
MDEGKGKRKRQDRQAGASENVESKAPKVMKHSTASSPPKGLEQLRVHQHEEARGEISVVLREQVDHLTRHDVDAFWYENLPGTQLLAIPAAELNKRFQAHPIEDHDHFCEIVQAKIEGLTAKGSWEADRLAKPDTIATIVRIAVEIAKAPQPSGAYHALHLLVDLTALLTCLNRMAAFAGVGSLLFGDDLEIQISVVHRMIECLLNRAPFDSALGLPPIVAHPEYYNASQARSQMRSHLERDDCGLLVCDYVNGEDYFLDGEVPEEEEVFAAPCTHERSAPILALLQKTAQAETHRNALLACGGYLPVELVDLVFEHALVAEGLPSICTPNSTDSGGSAASLVDEYRCDMILFRDERSKALA